MPPVSYDLPALRARLAAAGPRAMWRSLDAIADTPSFRSFLEAEFPSVATLATGPERRRFLKLMAASLSLAGLAGCDDKDPRDQEVPYVRNPSRTEPGTWSSYASVALIDGFANGVLVRTRDGRPIKIEGNPEHPWSRGGTDVFGQASVLGLYDPQRSQSVQYLSRGSDWTAFRGAMTGRFAALRAQDGRGLAVLTGTITSPSQLAQLAAMQAAFPQMHRYSHVPVDRTALYEGASRAFGRPVETRYRLDRAQVIVSLDGDLLDPGPHQVGVARDWVTARRRAAAAGSLLELHAAASVPSLTSAKADYSVVASPAEIAALARGLLGGPAASGPLGAWQARAKAALDSARSKGIVVAGSWQPPEIQEAAHRLNAALGNAGKTVFYTAPVAAPAEPLAKLTRAMTAGEVEILLMLDTNPVYDAPGDLGFTQALAKVGLKIHAGLYVDETASYADWHLPLAHPYESWGDARSVDGTVGLMQPVIRPLYEGRTVPEIISLLADPAPQDGLALLRAHWQQGEPAATFEPRWHAAIEAGFVAGTSLPEENVSLVPQIASAAPATTGLEVVFRPDPTVWDGSLANNAWLQELPKPLTKLVWENAITVAPRLAERLGLTTGDIVSLNANGRELQAPLWLLPGQSESVIGVALGYGRNVPDLLSRGLGYDAYTLRSSTSPWHLAGATLNRTGRRGSLVSTQDHSSMEGHDFVLIQPLGKSPVGETVSFTQPTLYPPQESDGRAWGMVIDLDSCIGCNACVTACQAENNIAVVGPEQVALGREMHWLRVDRYYAGAIDTPGTHFQPVPCMHCEQAPCEVACPVEATVHDHEGLNLMVYNRCVGTRACESYCPYKIRHFNYLDYSAGAAPSLQLRENPDVTVRAKGVMEKCTYCVQRIAAARIESDKSNTPIPDGAVETACQGACPTRAISFGDLNTPGSAVRTARDDPRNYALLGELNTRPRTTYLAALAPGDGAQHG